MVAPPTRTYIMPFRSPCAVFADVFGHAKSLGDELYNAVSLALRSVCGRFWACQIVGRNLNPGEFGRTAAHTHTHTHRQTHTQTHTHTHTQQHTKLIHCHTHTHTQQQHTDPPPQISRSAPPGLKKLKKKKNSDFVLCLAPAA
jgi:hypothetical protein